MELDPDSLNDGTLRGQSVTMARVQDLVKQPLALRMVPPSLKGARYVERQGTGLTESMDYAKMLLGQLGVLSGVPSYIWGATPLVMKQSGCSSMAKPR